MTKEIRAGYVKLLFNTIQLINSIPSLALLLFLPSFLEHKQLQLLQTSETLQRIPVTVFFIGLFSFSTILFPHPLTNDKKRKSLTELYCKTPKRSATFFFIVVHTFFRPFHITGLLDIAKQRKGRDEAGGTKR